MGSEDFCIEVTAISPADLMDRFYELSERDSDEYGNGAYSGTIGQKFGVEIVSIAPQSKLDAYRYAQNDRNRGGKWDSEAKAVPYFEKVKFGKPRTKTILVESESSYDVYDSVVRKLNDPLSEFVIESRRKVSDPKFKLEKVEVEKGWRVGNRVVEKKKEALKEYKEYVMNGGRAPFFYKDFEYKRLISKPTVWEVTIEIQNMKETKNLGGYLVWGTAAC